MVEHDEEGKLNKVLAQIGEALLVFVCIFILTITNLFSPIDYILKDNLYQRPRGVDNRIKIIAIDDRTLEELGPFGTWSRSVYADLIEQLNADPEAKPAVISFDILFSGKMEDAAGDEQFAKVAGESDNVVVVSQLSYSEKPQQNEKGLKSYPVVDVLYPYEALRNNTVCGYANVAEDSDGKVRRVVIQDTYEGETLDMFPKVVYQTYCEKMGGDLYSVATDKYGRAIINYSGVPGDYEAISLIDVLQGKLDPRVFKDSIVLVGAYAVGLQDNFSVPNGHGRQMYGVEIHANILQGYTQQRFAVNGNPYIAGAVFGLLGAVLHLIYRRRKVWLSTGLLVVSIVGVIFAGVTLNNQGTSISLVYFPLVTIVSYIYALAIGYVKELLHKKKMMSAFKKYVAPEVVEEIAKQGDFQIKLGGENRDVAVLFVDIRGFTTMSEKLEPEEIVAILNEYLELTTKSIFKNKGTLDKFIGDATMAVFNSPFELEDYEFKAVCAAMDIVEGGNALEAKLMEKYGRTVGFGVGVNCGPAVVGNVGCEFRMDFTAIGDTVNTAARLEANAKKGQVLISDVLYERIKERVEVREIGNIPLKGKSNGVFVYEVTSINR